VLICSFEQDDQTTSLALAAAMRSQGLRVEWYPDADRLPRQLKYADRQAIPLVAILGPEEVAAGQVSIKDLRSGEQMRVPRDEAAAAAARFLGRA
jgi:histidyl-tRNA synthetase